MATIVCPSCSAQYRISDDKISEKSRLRCKKCGAVFRLRDTLQESEEPPRPSGTGPTQPGKEKPSQPIRPSSEVPTLEFDLSAIQLHTPSAPQELETSPSQEDLSLDMNLGDIALDFGASSESPSEGETLSFGSSGPLGTEAALEEEELHDHIANITIDQPDIDFSGFSFQADQQERSGETPDDSLDFSFSANIPEETGEDEEEGVEGEDEFEGIPAESQASHEDQDIGLSLGEANLETPPGDLPISPGEDQGMVVSSEEGEMGHLTDLEAPAPEEEAFPEAELANCCIDSLAMGLLRCEICGRDLKDYQKYANELQQQRRKQLKEELVKAEVQIGFSEETYEPDVDGGRVSPNEDFSDVERALDALADGSFQESIKKKEAKKTRAKTLRMVVAVIVAAVVGVGGILWYLLPSSHEKLLARYEELMTQKEADPTTLVRLFLDAVIEKDEEIFRNLTVMTAMPEITAGKILGASEEVEKTSIGSPGQNIALLNEEIATLEKQISEKTKLLHEYSSKTFSPAALEQTIQSLQKKIDDLHAEFEAKDAELAKKLLDLQEELQETEEEIAKNKDISRKYLDATDTVGKALYTNSVAQLRSLGDKKGQLETQIQKEQAEYQQNFQALKNEYAPRFSELEERLTQSQSMLKEANLLQDREKSPVVILSKELEQMTAEIIEKKNRLEQAENQQNDALRFFKQPEKKSRVMKEQATAEFSYIEKNVAVMLKLGTSSEQQVSVGLKRYEAMLSDTTVQSNWLVEKIAK